MHSLLRDQQIWRRMATEAPVVAVVAAFLILYVDLPVALRLAHNTSGAPVALLDAISHLGRGEYYLAAAALLLGLGWWRLRRIEACQRGWAMLHAGSLILGTLAIGHLLVFVLKQTVARLRPSELLRAGEYGFAAPFSGEPFTSLPSSHSFTAFAMAAVLSRLQPELRAVFFGAAMLVAVQRLLAQQHFLSDVFVSLFLALMVSAAMQALWQGAVPRLARRLTRLSAPATRRPRLPRR
jgi:membrane-associated phospholipid phosphatase